MDKEATQYSTTKIPSFSSQMLERRLYFSSLVNHPGLAVSRFAPWQNTQIPDSVLKISISQTSVASKSSLKVLLHRIIPQSTTHIKYGKTNFINILNMIAKLTDI